MILTTGQLLWLCSLLAAVSYLWMGWVSVRAVVQALPPTDAAQTSAKPHDKPQRVLLAAWSLHALALFVGLYHSELRFGFAPALSMTAWIALTVYVIESRLFPGLRTHWSWALVGAVAVLLAAVWPGASHLSTGIAASHWVLGLAAYGLFAAAAIHAWLLARSERRLRSLQTGDAASQLPVMTLERLMFQYVLAGFLFLTATLVVGAWFDQDLSHWWKQHKITFSLLAWLVIAVLLAGRARLGWRGKKAARFLYTGTGLLLLAYAGTRFVLEVILQR